MSALKAFAIGECTGWLGGMLLGVILGGALSLWSVGHELRTAQDIQQLIVQARRVEREQVMKLLLATQDHRAMHSVLSKDMHLFQTRIGKLQIALRNEVRELSADLKALYRLDYYLDMKTPTLQERITP